MTMPSELTMQRLTAAIADAVELRPDLVDELTTAIDHLEWLTEHGLATDATWRDVTVGIASKVLASGPAA